MAMVNNFSNVKDSRWLQLEVCREYQRNKCNRQDSDCKFAHPPTHVEIQNGKVIACYDSIKGRCNREKPPCKYFHPPQHLKDQLLANGRTHLALKNALMQQLPLQTVLPGQLPAVATTNPYMTSLPSIATSSSYGPYLTPSPVMPGMVPADVMATPLSVVPTSLVAAHKLPRADRLEAFPGMVPYTKRPALDKNGLPVYQPSGTTYVQQALALQVQQPFVPVSFTGHPASLPRF
ncbi:protein muscleblind-like isoform X2 [Centruroides vittatus]|uniref:protein muscleblind-like isoform X2 n=1 Tax=Centruroides sculpturatus TaxID=218467 RepID=UPI000C6CBA39|nr:protein muscleblind-like isoform X2 [Centruroides sculpturatus]